MPLVSSYDETTLRMYMQDGVLKSTGAVLGLTSPADYAEAVNEVGVALGAGAPWTSDLGRVRALARREAWRLAMQQAAGDYQYTDLAGESNRQQVYEHCVAQYELAAQEVAALPPTSGSTASTQGGVSVALRNQAVW